MKHSPRTDSLRDGIEFPRLPLLVKHLEISSVIANSGQMSTPSRGLEPKPREGCADAEVT